MELGGKRWRLMGWKEMERGVVTEAAQGEVCTEPGAVFVDAPHV